MAQDIVITDRGAAISGWIVRRRRWLAASAVALVALLGFTALHLVLAEVRLGDVRGALAGIAGWRIATAAGLTAASYAVLTFYDWIALSVVGKPQSWRLSALGSFTGYAISYNLGVPLVTAGSARYRVYSQAGLSLADVVQVGAIGTIAFWSGVAATAGIALVVAPRSLVLGHWGVDSLATRMIGGALLCVAATVPLLRILGRRQLTLGPLRLPLPGGRQIAGLALASVLDLAAASAALFVLLPGFSWASYPAFFISYALAIIVAVAAHVPGGLGVFEAVVLAALPADRPAVFAGLLLYRIVYYLLPLIVAAGIVALREARTLRRPIGAGLSLIDKVGHALAPGAVTLLVFIGGFVLLASGALPGVGNRLDRLDALLPLPLIEGSHLAGSLIGTALLLIAPALNARLRSGFLVARPLLLAGALVSLLKGLDYEEASFQLLVLGILQYARPGFYRRGGIATEPLDRRWLAAAAAALALSSWAGLFAYKRLPYSDDLWWQFALYGDAPRFLRATFAAGILLTATASWHLVIGRAARSESGTLPPDVAARAFASAARTDANLAFTGDKRFIVAAAGDAFLMYGIRGRIWIVMGDPVGPPAAWSELAWRIRQACDAAGGRLCFYQASTAMLPILIDLGLDIMKYGEEARVALASFSLQGRGAKDLRLALRRADQAGLAFAVVPPAEVRQILDELQVVSTAWLATKPGAEKRFSLGPFDPAYLECFPVAVIRQAGRVIAFSNIWTSAFGGEMSVDLMRHLPDVPAGTMDFLFVRLFEWGSAHGYGWFNLGMAPLSGLPKGRLAPIWAKIGRTLYERGDRLYCFTGLRAFKAKFRPTWQPRYIATPRGMSRIRALLGLLRAVNS